MGCRNFSRRGFRFIRRISARGMLGIERKGCWLFLLSEELAVARPVLFGDFLDNFKGICRNGYNFKTGVVQKWLDIVGATPSAAGDEFNEGFSGNIFHEIQAQVKILT